jgi:hypothetical protein
MCPVQSATHVSGRLLRKKASFTERRRAAFQFEFTFIDSRGFPFDLSCHEHLRSRAAPVAHIGPPQGRRRLR